MSSSAAPATWIAQRLLRPTGAYLLAALAASFALWWAAEVLDAALRGHPAGELISLGEPPVLMVFLIAAAYLALPAAALAWTAHALAAPRPHVEVIAGAVLGAGFTYTLMAAIGPDTWVDVLVGEDGRRLGRIALLLLAAFSGGVGGLVYAWVAGPRR